MQNPENYVDHLLNTSTTKQTFSFPKAQRFQLGHRYSSNDLLYQLPSNNSRRSCSFGYGTKVDFADRKKVIPPPGSYELPTDFNPRNNRHHTISFSQGRNSVKFGYFLNSAQKLKTLPSPQTYSVNLKNFSKRGGRIAAKLPTEIDISLKKKVPGPGTYKLDATEMKSSGSYILSRYRNKMSPKYLSPSSGSRSCSPEPNVGPGQYEVGNEKFGKSISSKFKNSITSSFMKSRRPSMADGSKKNFPSFKYKRFSQFGGNN